MRITKSKATVYTASGTRRYLSRAAALGGLARQFIRRTCDCDEGGHCWYHVGDGDNFDFAVRELIKIFRRAENEDKSDEWIDGEWDKVYEAEMERQEALPKEPEFEPSVSTEDLFL